MSIFIIFESAGVLFEGAFSLRVSLMTVCNCSFKLLTVANFHCHIQYLTKGFGQIHEIKQNRFFYEMFTADTVRFSTGKRQTLDFVWLAEYSPSNPII